MCSLVQLSTVDHCQTSPMELWTHQVEQTTSVQQSIHVTQDMFSMEISQEHVKRMQTGVGVNQLVMVSFSPDTFCIHSLCNFRYSVYKIT